MTYPCCSGTDGHATWCTSTPRMLAGEEVTYTTVARHVWSILTDEINNRHCWVCSCGALGAWKTTPLQAEQGAKTHARRSK